MDYCRLRGRAIRDLAGRRVHGLEYAILASIVSLCVGSAVYAQNPFWAYTVPSTPRKLYVHGRDLFGGHEGDSRQPQARLASGQNLPFDRDVLVDELNRALHEVLIFTVRDEIPEGEQTVEITRIDGKKSTVNARIGPIGNTDPPRMGGVVDLTGEYEPLTSPKIISSDYDGRGITLYPTSSFVGRSLVIMKAGTIRNCRIVVPEHLANPNYGIEISSDRPVVVSNVEIDIRRAGGYGLKLTKCFESTFSNLNTIAARPYHADPKDNHGRNIFYRCKAYADRPGTGIAGRAFLSDQCLVVESSWHNLDRGPVGQQAGPPLYRTLLYRCSQSNTGTTVGGSEGVLWESIVSTQVNAKIEGNKVTVEGDPGDAAPGRAIMLLDGSRKWARIVSSNGGEITTDRDLGSTNTRVSIGNAILENTVANCSFSSGKNAVYYFGRSIGNAIVGGEAREISDVVVIHEKDAPGYLAFDWGNYRRWFRVNQSCGREIYRPNMYYDPTKPPSQLPWLRLVP